MTFCTELTLLIFTPAVAIAAVGFVAKSLFSQMLSRDLEKFKAQIQQRETEHKADLDNSAADYRAQLDRIAREHQILFSHMHQKRAEVIESLYEKISLTEIAFHKMTLRLLNEAIPPEETRIAEFSKYADSFTHYYHTHRIFLDEPRCKKVDQFVHMLRTGVINHETWLETANLSRERELLEQRAEMYQAVEKVKELMPEIRRDIEAEFRAILGVCSELKRENQNV